MLESTLSRQKENLFRHTRCVSKVLAPGSIPFVPPGIQVDEKTVFTSDDGLLLNNATPEYVASIGSRYIGLEVTTSSNCMLAIFHQMFVISIAFVLCAFGLAFPYRS